MAILKQTIRFIQAQYKIIFLIQIPLACIIVLQKVLDPYLEQNPMQAMVFLLPLLSLGSSVGTALTFLAVSHSSNKTTLRFSSDLLSPLVPKLKTLIISSLLIALFFGLGLAAFVLPGIFFMTLYFFVPVLIMADPIQPIARYFYKSKRLVFLTKKTFGITLALVLITFLIEIPISYLVELLESFVGYPLIFDISLSMIVTGFFDVFICFYFLNLKAKEN